MDSKEKATLIKALTQLKRRKELDAQPNTWEWVEDIRNEILTDTENYPWRSACEELWKFVSDFQNDMTLNVERNEKSGNYPIESLSNWLEIPRYPPIEVLAAISEAFDIYMLAGGDLSLEDVFFGPTKKGVGNYSARKAREEPYRMFHMYLSMDRLKSNHKGEKPRDLENFATEYLASRGSYFAAQVLEIEPDYDNAKDPESFLRGYRRWKKDVASKKK